MVDAHLEAERRRKRSMNGGSNIRGNEKPLQKGDGIDLSHHSQMVGHYTGGAYNGQNTPVTGFERFVGGEF